MQNGLQSFSREGNLDFGQARPISQAQASEFIAGVYRWMAAGLGITAITAYGVISSPGLMNTLFGNPVLFYGLIFAELGLVFWLMLRINKMSATTATTAFIGYSALNGVTLSVLLLAYTASSVAQTFVITAGTFAAVSVWGYTTKRDLTGMGSFLMMGVIGILIASVVNMFVGSSQMEWIISVIGVGVFTGLAAWDAQRLKYLAATIGSRGEAAAKATIIGALSLYLDFINMFIFLLRLIGDRRD